MLKTEEQIFTVMQKMNQLKKLIQWDFWVQLEAQRLLVLPVPVAPPFRSRFPLLEHLDALIDLRTVVREFAV